MNHRVVRKRLQEIQENQAILAELRTLTFQEFAADPKIYKLAERCFQLCIECVIDVANYLIAQNEWEQPESAKEAIGALGDHEVIDDLFADSIAGMVGFRNILVHGYLSIDRAVVFDNLKRLEDFELFQKQIVEFLDRQPSGGGGDTKETP